ncbi:hypothetical protein D3C73_974120 [compost metagenome]
MVGRQHAIFEEQFIGGRSAPTDLLQLAPQTETGGIGRQDKVGDFLAPVVPRAGNCCDHDRTGDVGPRIGDEGLGTIDDPLTVSQNGTGLDIGGVRACIRLGQPNAADLRPVDDGAQVTLLLRRSAIVVDQAGGRGIGHHGRCHSRVYPGDFLQHNGKAKPVPATATVLLRVGKAEEAQLSGLLPDLIGKLLLLPKAFGDRCNLLLGEPSDGIANHYMLLIHQ